MKKTTLIILFTIMTLSGFAQEDWFGFNRYRADNERIIASGEFPEVVFMGNSITEYWALYHPEFFRQHNFCGRGIGGQTSTQMLARFTADVGIRTHSTTNILTPRSSAPSLSAAATSYGVVTGT